MRTSFTASSKVKTVGSLSIWGVEVTWNESCTEEIRSRVPTSKRAFEKAKLVLTARRIPTEMRMRFDKCLKCGFI